MLPKWFWDKCPCPALQTLHISGGKKKFFSLGQMCFIQCHAWWSIQYNSLLLSQEQAIYSPCHSQAWLPPELSARLAGALGDVNSILYSENQCPGCRSSCLRPLHCVFNMISELVATLVNHARSSKRDTVVSYSSRYDSMVDLQMMQS